MTAPYTPEIDVEDFTVAWLGTWNLVPAGQVAARTPVVLPLPYILVQRVAGGDDYITDKATISIHSFHNTETGASDIARGVHHAMRTLSPKTLVKVNGVYVTMNRIEFEMAPIFEQWEDPVVMRYVARYVIDVRLPLIPLF